MFCSSAEAPGPAKGVTSCERPLIVRWTSAAAQERTSKWGGYPDVSHGSGRGISGHAQHSNCKAELALKVIQGRCRLLILPELLDGVRRLADLQRALAVATGRGNWLFAFGGGIRIESPDGLLQELVERCREAVEAQDTGETQAPGLGSRRRGRLEELQNRWQVACAPAGQRCGRTQRFLR